MFFGALMLQVLFILAMINMARKRRAKCDWSLSKSQKRAWLAAVGVIIGLVVPILGQAQPWSPMAIVCTALMLYSVYLLSKALYRKADLRNLPTEQQPVADPVPLINSHQERIGEPVSKWNLRRGLNRLFVVFAICYYIVAGVLLWPRWANAIITDWQTVSPMTPREFMQRESAIASEQSEAIWLTAEVFVVPPGIYSFAAAVAWIIVGFRQDPNRREGI